MLDFLGGIANAIGGFLSNQQTTAANMQMLKASQKFNREEAVTNRNWMADMSNTAYQRAMSDMRKAGLNPMLAMDNGGASTPQSGPAHVSAPSIPKLTNFIGEGVSSALDLYKGLAAVQNVDADTALKNAQAGKVPAEVDKLKAEIENLAGMRLPPGAMEKLNQAQIQEVLAGAQARLASAGESSAHASLYKTQEEVQTYVRDFLRKHQVYPGTDTGVRVGPIQTGPSLQRRPGLENAGTSLGGMIQSGYDRLFGPSARSQPDAQTGALREKAADAIKIIIRGQDQRTPPGERRTPRPQQRLPAYQNRQDNQ